MCESCSDGAAKKIDKIDSSENSKGGKFDFQVRWINWIERLSSVLTNDSFGWIIASFFFFNEKKTRIFFFSFFFLFNLRPLFIPSHYWAFSLSHLCSHSPPVCLILPWFPFVLLHFVSSVPVSFFLLLLLRMFG